RRHRDRQPCRHGPLAGPPPPPQLPRFLAGEGPTLSPGEGGNWELAIALGHGEAVCHGEMPGVTSLCPDAWSGCLIRLRRARWPADVEDLAVQLHAVMWLRATASPRCLRTTPVTTRWPRRRRRHGRQDDRHHREDEGPRRAKPPYAAAAPRVDTGSPLWFARP